MAIRLQKFNQIQYGIFKEFGIQEYAKALVKSGHYSREKALEKAAEEFNNILSQGLNTPDNYLYSIINEENIDAGYLWYHVHKDGKAFLCDFFINEDFRRKGYATQALALLEQEVKQLGCDKIVLNVFDYNIEANALYEKCGYEFSAIGQKGCRYLKKSVK